MSKIFFEIFNIASIWIYNSTKTLIYKSCAYLIRFSAKISQQNQIKIRIRILNSNPNTFFEIASNISIFLVFKKWVGSLMQFQGVSYFHYTLLFRWMLCQCGSISPIRTLVRVGRQKSSLQQQHWRLTCVTLWNWD